MATAVRATVTGTEARGRRALLPAVWSVAVLFAGVPLWWILGIWAFIWPVVAVPVFFGFFLRREVRLPRGIGLWFLFLGWMAASALQLDSAERGIVVFYRASLYGSATIMLVHAFNAQAEDRSRIPLFMAIFGAFIVLMGFVALVFPNFSMHSPMESVLPTRLVGNPWIHDLTHVRTAQVNDFLGYAISRPAAPFAYTNEWGSNLALTVPFLILATTTVRTRTWRRAAFGVLVVSIVPIVISVNRGLWVSLSVGLLYAMVRLNLHRRMRGVGGVLLGAGVVVAALIVLTPLGNVVGERIATGHSDEGRLSLYRQSIEASMESPWFGFGTSIQSTENPNLPAIGSHGHVWLVLVSNGIPALVLFLGWFAFLIWRTRHARTPLAFWSHICIVIGTVQLAFYDLLPSQIHIVMIAAGLALADRVVRHREVPAAGERAA